MVWAFLTVLDRFFSFILNEIARRLDTKKAAFAAGCMPEINAKKALCYFEVDRAKTLGFC